MADNKEQTLWRGRPSYWNWWTQLAIGDLFIVLAIALWWAGRGEYAPWASGAATFFYLVALAGRYSVLYTLTDQRVIARAGLFSRRVDEVEIRDIRNIVLEQSFLQRLVGIGDIGISSAGGEGIEVRFGRIPRAEAVKERIRQARMDSGGPHDR
ncbi:MAG: PH domain-containing protein [Elusimicrobiota bacterium]